MKFGPNLRLAGLVWKSVWYSKYHKIDNQKSIEGTQHILNSFLVILMQKTHNENILFYQNQNITINHLFFSNDVSFSKSNLTGGWIAMQMMENISCFLFRSFNDLNQTIDGCFPIESYIVWRWFHLNISQLFLCFIFTSFVVILLMYREDELFCCWHLKMSVSDM